MYRMSILCGVSLLLLGCQNEGGDIGKQRPIVEKSEVAKERPAAREASLAKSKKTSPPQKSQPERDIPKDQPPAPDESEIEAEKLKKVMRSYFHARIWQDRIQYVTEPEKTKPLMSRYYGNRYRASPDVRVHVPDEFDLQVGQSADVQVRVSAVLGPRLLFYTVVKTDDDYKIDWVASIGKRELTSRGILTAGRIAEKNDSPTVTVKDLEINGVSYKQKKVKLLSCRFRELNIRRLSELPWVGIASDGFVVEIDKAESEKWVGLVFVDTESNYFYRGFANKAMYFKQLSRMKRDDLFNIQGKVIELNEAGEYGLVVTDIEVLKFEK